jgi:eukaryotic-like serine/threonine-protein kinase
MRLVSSTLATSLVLALLVPAPQAGAGDKTSKLERDAREALKEAAALGEQAKTLTGDLCRWQVVLVRATEAVTRAEILLSHVRGGDPALKQQLRKLKAALSQQEKERQLIERLEAIRLQQSFDRGGQTGRQYAAAFRAYGLSVGEGEAGTAAARLREQPTAVREAVLSALDHWALSVGRNQQERAWLRDVLKAADPDPWRTRLREAVARGDAPGLKKLAAGADLARQPPATVSVLAVALGQTGATAEAVTVLRQAQQRHPADFWLNHQLALALLQLRPPQPTEAVRFLTAALALRPHDPAVHVNLGFALLETGKAEEAIAVYRNAIRLRPDLTVAYLGLGQALTRQCASDEAVAAFRQALRLQPDNATAHHRLGRTLYAQGKLDEAIATFREAIRLQPNYAPAHNDLGIALRATGRLDDALAAQRKAIRLNPRLVGAFTQLGHTLAARGDLEEAVAAYRESLRSDPPADVEAPFGLGKVLARMGRLDEAVVSLKRVLELKPDWAEAHGELGHALKRQGRFAEALAALKRGHELGAKQPGRRDRSAEWVKEAERLVELDARLPAILKGKAQPADAAEQLDWARLCRYKRLTAASARFYAEALAARPKLAEDPASANLVGAARAAALAGTGKGEDAGALDAAQRARLRQQALGWLRADLAANHKRLKTGGAEGRATVAARLRQWQREPDLAGVRDGGIAALPQDERQAWTDLWDEVRALLRQARP